jgi:hypothetical protein
VKPEHAEASPIFLTKAGSVSHILTLFFPHIYIFNSKQIIWTESDLVFVENTHRKTVLV